MSEEIKITVEPGGMLSDVVETELGPMQHQTVKNLRQNKRGLWEIVDGAIQLFQDATYKTNIKAAIEIDDEYSGDRFILFQHGTGLYRVDYDDGDGNGYENEAAAAVSLPSGVTIGATATLRFFYFRGVVRISGASSPMWYSYISGRTWFADALENIDTDDFNTDEESWTGNTATAAVSADQCIFETIDDANSLKVTQTGADGTARKTFTLVSGEDYIFRCWIWKDTVGSDGNPTIALGSSAYGGTEYGSQTITDRDEWVKVEKTFTATGTSLYVEFNPGSGASDDIGYMDYVWLDRVGCSNAVSAGWKLVKAELAVETLECPANAYDGCSDDEYGNPTKSSSDNHGIFCKYSFVYDEAQYSLPEDITRDFTPGALHPLVLDNQVSYTGNQFQRFKIRVPGSALETTFINDRITGLCIFLKSVVMGSGTIVNDDDSDPFYLFNDIDLLSALDDIVYERDNFYWVDTIVNRLYINYGGTYSDDVCTYDGYFQKGAAVTLKTVTDEIDTVVARVNADANGLYIDFVDDLTAIIAGGATTDIQIGVKITPKWYYDSSEGYSFWQCVDADSPPAANEAYDYIDIPAGTSDINPDYTHHVVIEDRAYVNSGEDEEQDVVRYSPLYQLDSFPNGQIIQTQVGDSDTIRAIVKRANRLVILKRKSFSQGNFVGGSYYEDIGIANQGLYSTAVFAFMVAEDILYFMDQEDIFAWNGVQLVPLLNTMGIKEYYKSYVDTDSLFIYDKQNREIWAVLKTGATDHILVFDMDRKEWYTRETAYTLLGSYLDVDNQLIAFDATTFHQYNHSETTFSETINWQIVTKIFDLNNPHKYKKLKKIEMVVKSNGTVAITASDDNESISYSGTITPSSTILADKYALPKYLFKQLELTMAGSAAATNMTLQMRKFFIDVVRW